MEKVKSGKFDFNPIPFENVSNQSKNFIRELLVKNYNKRPSCLECLQHDWFQVEMEEKVISKELMKNL